MGKEIAGGGTVSVPVREFRDGAMGVSMGATLEQAVRLTAVVMEIGGVERSRMLVDYVGMPADALDGFASSQISGKKLLHAPADDEGFFVLQV